MKFETKFELGDEVWTIEKRHRIEVSSCPSCEGHGWIKTKDKEIWNCPNCRGERTKLEHRPFVWMLNAYDGPMIIGEIQMKIRAMGHVDEDHPAKHVEYMLEETGVGSGTIWHEEELFKTKEQAERDCVRRNENEKVLAEEKNRP